MICFTGRDEKLYWWDRLWLTDSDFRHCYALQFQPCTERWVMMDWRTGICDIVVIHTDEMPYVLGQLKAAGGCAILYKAAMPEHEINYRIPIIYCVQAILQLMGIPTRWTFTPKQLYNRLIRSGGAEVCNYRRNNDGKSWRWWWLKQEAEGNKQDHA